MSHIRPYKKDLLKILNLKGSVLKEFNSRERFCLNYFIKIALSIKPQKRLEIFVSAIILFDAANVFDGTINDRQIEK